ncbi:MAG: hypothetical protein CMO80_15825 [Verrucomicrobiales bacterium]|nr:hypothetical protein [Verrucomicrobiales bacterium]
MSDVPAELLIWRVRSKLSEHLSTPAQQVLCPSERIIHSDINSSVCGGSRKLIPPLLVRADGSPVHQDIRF